MQKWKVKRFKNEQGGQEMEIVNFGYLRDLILPEDSVKIWRFMDLPKFLSIIQTKTLYFARADQFEDPFEGARGQTGDENVYTNALVEALKNEFESVGTKEPINRMIQFSFFLLYRYKVVLLMPVVSSICEIEQTLESYMLNARSILDLSFGGRPPLRPLARAACKPSIVLCRIKSRSN